MAEQGNAELANRVGTAELSADDRALLAAHDREADLPETGLEKHALDKLAEMPPPTPVNPKPGRRWYQRPWVLGTAAAAALLGAIAVDSGRKNTNTAPAEGQGTSVSAPADSGLRSVEAGPKVELAENQVVEAFAEGFAGDLHTIIAANGGHPAESPTNEGNAFESALTDAGYSFSVDGSKKPDGTPDLTNLSDAGISSVVEEPGEDGLPVTKTVEGFHFTRSREDGTWTVTVIGNDESGVHHIFDYTTNPEQAALAPAEMLGEESGGGTHEVLPLDSESLALLRLDSTQYLNNAKNGQAHGSNTFKSLEQPK